MLKVKEYLLRGNGVTVTFDDGRIIEIVYDPEDLTPSRQLDNEERSAIISFLGSVSIDDAIDPRFGAASANNRQFASESAVSPTTPGNPTVAEIAAWASSNSITDTIIFYTGTNNSADPITRVYHVDVSGNVTLLDDPTSGGGGGGGTAVFDTLTVTGPSSVGPLSQPPSDPSTVQFYVNGVNESPSFSVTGVNVAVNTVSLGYSLNQSEDVVTAYYLV